MRDRVRLQRELDRSREDNNLLRKEIDSIEGWNLEGSETVLRTKAWDELEATSISPENFRHEYVNVLYSRIISCRRAPLRGIHVFFI